MMNLLVDLRSGRFDRNAHASALRSIEAAGFSTETVSPGSARFAAWIDEQFGGTWSPEAFVASSVVAARSGSFAGFAAYDPQGLKFSWLRGLGTAPDVGIFGPFGVASEYRGSPVGPHLLAAALASLASAGYARALIPAVAHEKLVAYYERHAGARVAEVFDVESWRSRSYRAVVLASGYGTNFQSVIDAVNTGSLPLHLRLLVSNDSNAYALERAGRANIRAIALPWDREGQTRREYDAALLETVRREEPDLVLLLGWMHLLEDRFVASFPQTINIHPAFLPLDQRRDDVVFPDGSTTPAFRGPRAVADALSWGSRWVGASSHRVTPQTDRGPVLVRRPMPITPGETQKEILERLHPLEHRVLAGGIMRWVYER